MPAQGCDECLLFVYRPRISGLNARLCGFANLSISHGYSAKKLVKKPKFAARPADELPRNLNFRT
jgi:hypothetical protein